MRHRNVKVAVAVLVTVALLALALVFSSGLREKVIDRPIEWSPSPTYELTSATKVAPSPGRIRSYRLRGTVRSRRIKTKPRPMVVDGRRLRRVPVTYRARQVMWVGMGSGPNRNRELVKRWQNIYWAFRYEGHWAQKAYATRGWWVNDALDSAVIGWKHTDEMPVAVYHGVYEPQRCPHGPLYPSACIPWWHQDSASTFELCVFRLGCIARATIWTSQRVTPRRAPNGYSENAWRS